MHAIKYTDRMKTNTTVSRFYMHIMQLWRQQQCRNGRDSISRVDPIGSILIFAIDLFVLNCLLSFFFYRSTKLLHAERNKKQFYIHFTISRLNWVLSNAYACVICDRFTTYMFFIFISFSYWFWIYIEIQNSEQRMFYVYVITCIVCLADVGESFDGS